MSLSLDDPVYLRKTSLLETKNSSSAFLQKVLRHTQDQKEPTPPIMVKTDPNLNAAITKWDTYSEGGAPLHDHSPLSFPTLCPHLAYSNAYVYVCDSVYVCPLVYACDPVDVCPSFIPVIRLCLSFVYTCALIYDYSISAILSKPRSKLHPYLILFLFLVLFLVLVLDFVQHIQPTHPTPYSCWQTRRLLL